MLIEVRNIIQNEKGFTSEEGNKIYVNILKHINDNDIIELSFSKMSFMTLEFLQGIFGNLYGKHEENLIERKVNINGLDKSDQEILERIKINSIRFYQEEKKFDNFINDIKGWEKL